MWQRVRAIEGAPTEFDIPVPLFERRRDCYEPIGKPKATYQEATFAPVEPAVKTPPTGKPRTVKPRAKTSNKPRPEPAQEGASDVQ